MRASASNLSEIERQRRLSLVERRFEKNAVKSRDSELSPNPFLCRWKFRNRSCGAKTVPEIGTAEKNKAGKFPAARWTRAIRPARNQPPLIYCMLIISEICWEVNTSPPFNLFNLFRPCGITVILQFKLNRFDHFFSGLIIKLIK